MTDGYPSSTFDAEEADEIVRGVFSHVEVRRWDDELALLLTQRGCLVFARR